MPQPISPVIPGFSAPEVIFAKDQPPFIPLPTIVTPDGTITSRWYLTWAERLRVILGGSIWLQVQARQPPPMKLSVECPLFGHYMGDQESHD